MRRALKRGLLAAALAIPVVAGWSLWSPSGESAACPARAAAAPDDVGRADLDLVRLTVDKQLVTDAVPASAATEVVGRVVDVEGRAVAGALVVPRPLFGAFQDPLQGGVVTDRFGTFRFINLPPGQYWFLAVHGAHPFGVTPAMPVEDRLEVAITLDLAISAT